jgi:hypothetical protein
MDRLDNDLIQIDQISSEQNLPIDDQQDQNAIQNNIKSKEINEPKKTSMIPTALYSFFFSFLIIIQIFD